MYEGRAEIENHEYTSRLIVADAGPRHICSAMIRSNRAHPTPAHQLAPDQAMSTSTKTTVSINALSCEAFSQYRALGAIHTRRCAHEVQRARVEFEQKRAPAEVERLWPLYIHRWRLSCLALSRLGRRVCSFLRSPKCESDARRIPNYISDLFKTRPRRDEDSPVNRALGKTGQKNVWERGRWRWVGCEEIVPFV